MIGGEDAATRELLLDGLDTLRTGVAVFNAEDRLVYCNEHYRYIYRSLNSVNQLIGLTYRDILRLVVDNGEIAGREVLSDPEGWIARRMAERQSARSRPVAERLADGRWFEIKERAIPGGGVIGVWQDITDLKRGNLRLIGSLEGVADGLVLWDQSDRLLLCNQMFAELCGSGRRPNLGERFHRVARTLARHAFDTSELSEDYWLSTWAEQHGRPAGSHVTKLRDGRWFLVRERRNGDGGSVTVLSDITDLKKREEALILRGRSLESTVHELEMVQAKLEEQGAHIVGIAEQLNAAKREIEESYRGKTNFMRAVSHQLRTPLNAIIGFAEVLKDQLLGPVGNPRYAEYAGDIHTSGVHLLKLVNQLLDLSRLDAGRYELNLATGDIARVVHSAARIVNKQASDAGLDLVLDLPEGLPLLPFDEQAVRQVVVNLLSNAIKFTPAGGTIRVEGHRQGQGLTLSVRDNGLGMRAELVPRLLRPFERVDDGLHSHEGTGLGLPISKALVELHGGELQIQSVLGEGSSVTVHLPGDPPAAVCRPRSRAAVAS
jgi:signal transduction histidine kinase